MIQFTNQVVDDLDHSIRVLVYGRFFDRLRALVVGPSVVGLRCSGHRVADNLFQYVRQLRLLGLKPIKAIR